MARWTRSWVTLAAIFLLGTGLAWTAVQTFRAEIQQRATQDAVVTSRTVLSLVITRHLDAASLANGLSPAQVAELHRDVTVLQQDQKVVATHRMGVVHSRQTVHRLAPRRTRHHGCGERLSAQPARPQFAHRGAFGTAGRDLPAEALELEITETAVMTDPEAACGMLLQLRALGVRVSVDDFGAGYTSLSLLRSLPVHTLKIDRAFVTSMLDDPSCEAVVRCVIQLAKDLELSIIAEGVETPEVSQRLAALGCDEIQGWAVSRPMRPALVEGWLTEWAHSDRSATLSAGTDRRRITFPGVGYSG